MPKLCKAVTEAVSALPGAKGVQVSLEKGEVTWEEMGVEIEKVKEAIEDIGFDASMPTILLRSKVIELCLFKIKPAVGTKP